MEEVVVFDVGVDPFSDSGGGAGFGEVGVGCSEFSDETLVLDDLFTPFVEFGEEGRFDFGVGRVTDEVVDFVGVFFEVEEFDLRLLGRHEEGLGLVEFSLEVEDVHLGESGVGSFFVVRELAIGPLGHEVEDELVVAGADATHGVVGVVHLVAGGEDEFAVFDVVAEEAVSVKRNRRGDAGGFEDGGADVE